MVSLASLDMIQMEIRQLDYLQKSVRYKISFPLVPMVIKLRNCARL